MFTLDKKKQYLHNILMIYLQIQITKKIKYLKIIFISYYEEKRTIFISVIKPQLKKKKKKRKYAR